MKAHSYCEKPVYAVMIIGEFGYDTGITVAAFDCVVNAARWACGLGVRYTITMVDSGSVLVRNVKVIDRNVY